MPSDDKNSDVELYTIVKLLNPFRQLYNNLKYMCRIRRRIIAAVWNTVDRTAAAACPFVDSFGRRRLRRASSPLLVHPVRRRG